LIPKDSPGFAGFLRLGRPYDLQQKQTYVFLQHLRGAAGIPVQEALFTGILQDF